MRSTVVGWLVGIPACAMLAGCATTPPAPDPVRGIAMGAQQSLEVVTDPPGAACTVYQNGTAVASLERTPGVVAVPRDFGIRFLYDPPPSRVPPIEVVCRKEGYLDYRRAFPAAFAMRVAQEEAWKARTVAQRAPPPPEAEAAKALGGAAAVAIVGGAPQLATAAAAAGATVVAPLAVGVVALAVATRDMPRPMTYGYRPLPVLPLTPAAFPSRAACDDYFAALVRDLESARDARRVFIDAHCRFPPCRDDDPSPCGDPLCARMRDAANDDLAAELARIPGLRAQVRTPEPSPPDEAP